MAVWDMRPKARRTNLVALPEPKIEARASSHFTRETVEKRLRVLEGVQTDEADREREYLLGVLERMAE